MVKDQIVIQSVRVAAHRLVAVQHARQLLDRALEQLESVVPRMASDRVLDLALNHHTADEWLRMPPRAIERHLAAELGLRPVRATTRTKFRRRKAG